MSTTSSIRSAAPHQSDELTRSASRRRNVSIACNNCRSRRLKCSATLPSCSRCTETGKICIYEQDDNRKKTVWKSRIDSLKSENDQLKNIIDRLKSSTDADAAQLLRQLRDSHSPTRGLENQLSQLPSDRPGNETGVQQSDITTASRNDGDASVPSLPDSPTGLSEMFLQSVGKVPDDLSPEAILSNLPAEDVTRKVVASFFSCGATLFYVMAEEEASQLINAVYRSPHAEIEDICELCALAAIGGQYAMSDVSQEVRDCYFRYACALLQDSVDKDEMRSMRVFICLSMFSCMEKHHRVKGLIAYGLRIARYNLLGRVQSPAQEKNLLEWTRYLRTLAFLECWLSFTLGYAFKLTSKDILLISQLKSSQYPIVNADVIQAQMSRIALVSAQIYSEICHVKQPSWEMVQYHLKEIDRWAQELPEPLRRQTLVSVGDGMSPHRRRALFLVHMIHIGSHILLYQHVLGTIYHGMEKKEDEVDVIAFAQRAADIHQGYTTACRQQTQLVAQLYKEKGIFQRCWLVINTSYRSAVLTLLSMAHCLLLNQHPDSELTLAEDLARVASCLEVLAYCGQVDPAAKIYLGKLTPVYDSVKAILGSDAPSARPKTMSIDSIVNGSRPGCHELAAVVGRLVEMMLAPGEKVWTLGT